MSTLTHENPGLGGRSCTPLADSRSEPAAATDPTPRAPTPTLLPLPLLLRCCSWVSDTDDCFVIAGVVMDRTPLTEATTPPAASFRLWMLLLLVLDPPLTVLPLLCCTAVAAVAVSLPCGPLPCRRIADDARETGTWACGVEVLKL